jgi:hypothetical protein
MVTMEEHRNKLNAPTLLALVGASGSGKDTVAEHLARHGYERVAVADHLKRAVELIFNLSARQLWGDERDVVVEPLGLTPRELYQRFSDACRALDDEVWIRPFEAQLRDRRARDKLTIWTDVRTEAELELARRVGATVVRVLRSGAAAKGEAAAHHTETVLAKLSDDAFDLVIVNDGSLADLYRTIDGALLREVP